MARTPNSPTIERVMRAFASNAVAQAEALHRTDASWSSEVHPIGDGALVLSGRDMYVNRVFAAGIAIELTDDHVDVVLARSQSMGVQPCFEVTPLTLPATITLLDQRGFTHDPDDDVHVLIRPVPGRPIEAPEDIVVRPVTSGRHLQQWQAASTTNWGHTSQRARAVSDAFSNAAFLTDRDGMVLGFDTATDSTGTAAPVGCASVTLCDGLATLGAMSTHPRHRRRGVQAAMLEHRLRYAHRNGCDLAASTTRLGGASERNLLRHGFASLCEIATWKAP